MKDGSAATENNIDRTLDVAMIVVMSTFVIKKSVMGTIESTTIECNLVCTHICCDSLVM